MPPGKGVTWYGQFLPRAPRLAVDGARVSDLGLTVVASMTPAGSLERRAAYGCDITYGTNNEFGFDYLRDNMVVKLESECSAPVYAIVDEWTRS